MRGKPLSLELRKDIIELYTTTKHNSVTISREYSISASTVCKALKNGINQNRYRVLKSQKMREAQLIRYSKYQL